MLGDINVSKSKKIIVIIVCGICLFAAGFSAGRFVRLARVSGASGELESGIISAGSTTDSIIDHTVIAGNAAESAHSSGQAVDAGLSAMQQSTEQLRIFLDEVVRSVEADKEATRTFQQAHGDSNSASISAIDIAIQHAEQYEELIRSLQQAIDNYSKNSCQ